MADIKVGNVTYGAQELSTTFQTYRKDFIVMPFLAMQALAQHMNVRTGIRYKETVSQMAANAEISNYSKTKFEDADVKLLLVCLKLSSETSCRALTLTLFTSLFGVAM